MNYNGTKIERQRRQRKKQEKRACKIASKISCCAVLSVSHQNKSVLPLCYRLNLSSPQTLPSNNHFLQRLSNAVLQSCAGVWFKFTANCSINQRSIETETQAERKKGVNFLPDSRRFHSNAIIIVMTVLCGKGVLQSICVP